MTPNEIFQLVESDLEEVERELRRQAESDVHLIQKISHYLQESGGKRIRPALLLLASKLEPYQGPERIRLAAVMEMVHTATLVHDDIIDEANLRRGRASVNARWGNEITVLMGDWLYMTSFSMALGERNFKILDLLAGVTRRMVEGELLQLDFKDSLSISEEDHLRISERKTAFLFSACTQIGGLLSGINGSRLERLDAYGRNLGMAFQLTDDLLDFTSTAAALGKPIVHDLREGKLTLPLIYLLEMGIPGHREKLVAAMEENGYRDDAKLEVLRLVQEYGTLDKARLRAQNYARQARATLDCFEDSPARSALASIADFIVQRDR